MVLSSHLLLLLEMQAASHLLLELLAAFAQSNFFKFLLVESSLFQHFFFLLGKLISCHISLGMASWATWELFAKLCILFSNDEETLTSKIYWRQDELHLKSS